MKDFVLLFRQVVRDTPPSPQDMQELAKKWMEWIDTIVAQERLVSEGIRLAMEGKVLKPGGVVTDGPFVEIRERLGGFIVVKAESMDDAITLAHGCPVLNIGGSIEVRPYFA